MNDDDGTIEPTEGGIIVEEAIELLLDIDIEDDNDGCTCAIVVVAVGIVRLDELSGSEIGEAVIDGVDDVAESGMVSISWVLSKPGLDVFVDIDADLDTDFELDKTVELLLRNGNLSFNFLTFVI